MNKLADDQKFQELLGQKLADHEAMTAVGKIIRAKFPKPLTTLSALPKSYIIRALVATCVDEAEVVQVLSEAEFQKVTCKLLEESEEEKDFGLKAFLQVAGGIMIKDATPCTVEFVCS